MIRTRGMIRFTKRTTLRHWRARQYAVLRSRGRSKGRVERLAIAELLDYLLATGRFHLPLEILHRERPDFQIRSRQTCWGIEHTEAVPENWASKCLPGHDLPECPVGAPLDSKGQLLDSTQEWLSVMQRFITHKTRIAGKEGYQYFPANGLLIYDNWPLPGRINHPLAITNLHRTSAFSEAMRCFDCIWIITRRGIWTLAAQECFNQRQKKRKRLRYR